jgi:hypothetical protein
MGTKTSNQTKGDKSVQTLYLTWQREINQYKHTTLPNQTKGDKQVQKQDSNWSKGDKSVQTYHLTKENKCAQKKYYLTEGVKSMHKTIT